MQKHILRAGLLMLGVALYAPINAQWIPDSTTCTIDKATDITQKSSLTFPKEEGKYSLCMKEFAPWNPFATTTIKKCTGTSCTSAYIVDGQWYNQSHSLWKYRNTTTNEPVQTGWTKEITTKKSYWFDKTAPICGQTTIKNAQGTLYNGGWSSTDLWSYSTCSDALSGCDTTANNAATSGKRLEHTSTATPLLTFRDNAGNIANLNCSLPKTVLIDDRNPEITSVVINNTILPENINTTYQLAGPLSIKITSTDDPSNTYGVSGIKNITAAIKRTHDYKGTILSSPIGVCQGSYISPTPYNPDGSKVVADTQTLTINCSDTTGIQTAGTYEIQLSVTDEANNASGTKKITLIVSPNMSVSIVPTATTTPSTPFANHHDQYNYTLMIKDSYGNPIHSKRLSNIHVTEDSDIDMNTLDSSSETALDIDTRDIQTDITGKVSFHMQSYVPGIWKEEFAFNLPRWDVGYNNTTETIEYIGGRKISQKFGSPFQGKITLFEDDGTPTTRIILGQYQQLQLDIERHPSALIVVPDTLNFLRSGAMGTYPYDWVSGKNNQETDATKESTIETFIDSSTGKGKQVIHFMSEQVGPITGEVEIMATPVVKYLLDGKEVTYTITSGYTNFTPITLKGGDVNRIYIEGVKYTNGKDGLVITSKNMGTMNLADFGNAIRKNWALKTRNRTIKSGDIFDNIKYVQGSIELSGRIDGYKTLVVMDGNITINDDLNLEKKDFGIILLRSDASNTSMGNIYIKPNVSIIDATIYADGSIESVDESGKSFIESNTARGDILDRQLIFVGGLYTKNTVGGATLGNASSLYVLPGGKTTNSIHEAVRYDLSFLRMNNTGWDIAPQKNWNISHNESVVVLKNSNLIRNPLPLFGE